MKVSSTLELEQSSGNCSTCGSAQALDAAANAFTCTQCSFAGSNPLAAAQNIQLATGCYIDLFQEAFHQVNVDDLIAEVDFTQHNDVLPDGNQVSQPRLIAYQAISEGFVYSYPGISEPLRSSPFSPIVLEIKEQAERLLKDELALKNVTFNSAHINCYRNGNDHVSWHTDEDVDLYGDQPVIASVSFGARRAFFLRKMLGVPYQSGWTPDIQAELKEIQLDDCSLLVMRGFTQRRFEHCVAKSKKPDLKPRVNITFRICLEQGS